MQKPKTKQTSKQTHTHTQTTQEILQIKSILSNVKKSLESVNKFEVPGEKVQ